MIDPIVDVTKQAIDRLEGATKKVVELKRSRYEAYINLQVLVGILERSKAPADHKLQVAMDIIRKVIDLFGEEDKGK